MKVLGMGNALTDVLAKIEDDKLLDTMQLPKGSMQLIDEVKLDKLNAEIDKLNKEIVSGGSAANTIVGLARLGVDAGFVGRVGKDGFGECYKNDMARNNVRLHLVEVDGQPSGVATTFISKDGQRTFGTYLGAAALLSAEELKLSDFEGYDYFYIEGYLVQSHELIERAIVLAKQSGAKVILDLASYNVVEDNKDFLLAIVPQYVDVVFANEEEVHALFGATAEESVSILARDVEVAIVKAGAKGSWVQSGDEKVFTPAHVVTCVDTTGAGDLYASGFVYGLIHGCSLGVCAEMGTLLAGNVIRVVGPKIEESEWDGLISKVRNLAQG